MTFRDRIARTQVATPTVDALTEDERAAYDEIVRSRPGNGIVGPFTLWIRTPDLARAADRMALELGKNGVLEQRLYQLATLVAARHFNVHFVWVNHYPLAVRAGVDAKALDALCRNETPAFDQPDEDACYRLLRALMRGETISAGQFAQVYDLLGERALTELVTIAGFFSMTGMLMKCFDIQEPTGERPLDV
ncbi:carboxymuconolactone decarboxylase family protein [Amycolatopsis pithecellobii]|uniref:Uncharacterized protein n=1 Tax=Amycolatopsis pithecellobii TaxID=664692 RepID=A0A6N7ZBY0_9PSEU|nr:carboxymuconolactone decarboxylase family protein [Amycolatopsis pithecellobii]MTD59216.1 hypothetical protein [Amycolatopsis pithecellobii]